MIDYCRSNNKQLIVLDHYLYSGLRDPVLCFVDKTKCLLNSLTILINSSV